MKAASFLNSAHLPPASPAIVALTLVFCLALAAAPARAADEDTSDDAAGFQAVATILENNCIRCHDANGTTRGDVALSSHEAIFGPDAVGVIRPGRPERSRLLAMISGPEPEMPRQSAPLSEQQVKTIRDWIAVGAPWPDKDRTLQDRGMPDADWWSFKPLADAEPPELSAEDADWVRTDIDAFILAALREQGLSPSPEADRRTLIRRLYYDLTGLPPTYEQVQAFIEDDDPAAYEKLVDRLLASPAYGERWARHWLDMAGYGDTHGFDKDQLRENAYHYRDYVIRSFNEGKRYDRFVREQIAGDVLYGDTADGIIATGFLVAGPWDLVGHVELREGTADKKLTRVLDRDEMVHTVMGGFTSLTVNCARCHTHKFDPISHEDYYRMQAVFAGIERADRPFPADREAIAERERIEQKIARAEDRLSEIDKALRDRAGDRLAELDERIAALTDHRGGAEHPSRGFHSEIAADRDAPTWVQVDLGEPTELSAVVLAPTYDAFNSIGAGFGFPRRFKVELSDDPDFAEDVTVIADHTRADVANPGVTPHIVDAQNRTARYVRLTVTRRAERQDDYILALAELAALTPSGRNAALGQPVRAESSIETGDRWGRAYLTNGVYEAMSADEDVLPALAAAVIERQRLLDAALDETTLARREAIREEIDQLQQQRDAIGDGRGTVFAAASDFEPQGSFTPPPDNKPRPIHVLNRGEVTQPGKPVTAGALGALDHLQHHFDGIDDATDEGQRRVALAEWILDQRNPLTWRSIVNRIWHHHFGRGIVGSLDDFGRMGEQPTHPQLLDYLARRFRDGSQSFKDLHRMIVTSATYRQASTVRSDMAALDAGNHYLWRANARRLEAEAIRDSVLLTSGTLDRGMFGPGYHLFGLIDDHSPHYLYDEHDVDDPATLRRSIYRFIARSVPDPFMETLDCADPSQNVHERDTTLTALQALALMNNPFMVRQAEHFAGRVTEAAGPDADLATQINHAYRFALSRDAEAEEIDLLAPVAAEHGLVNVCRLILNANEFIFID